MKGRDKSQYMFTSMGYISTTYHIDLLTLKASVVAFTAQVEDVGSSSKTKAECFVKDRKDTYAYKCKLIFYQLPFIIIEDILVTNLWFCMNTRFSHFFVWKMVLRNHTTDTILDFLTTIPEVKNTSVVVNYSLYFAKIRLTQEEKTYFEMALFE